MQTRGCKAVNASRGTGSALDLAAGFGPRAATRPRRSHRKPARLLENVTASLLPIGRFVGHCRVTARFGCRLASAPTPSQPAAHTHTRANVGKAVVASTVHMSKKRCAMSDVEPSSSDGEQTEGARGDGSTRNIDGPETVAKRMAGSLAPPVPADVRFDANGGAYMRRQRPPSDGRCFRHPEGATALSRTESLAAAAQEGVSTPEMSAV